MVSQDVAGAMNGSPRAFPPAPVDPAALATALLPFGQSRMLPPAAYSSAEVFDWERQHFLGGGWTCAAHGSRLPAAGDQLAVDTGNGGALLVRGEDGKVRAFANTCRHRGHQLLPCGSSASAKAIVCPYHSWAYSLSGELRGAPGYREIPGFDASAWPLVSLPTVEWHGLVFVDGSGGAGGAPARAAGSGTAHGGLRRDLPQRAAEPAPGLRHDPHPHAGGGGPDADRLLVGVRARGGRRRVLRPGVRVRLMGPNHPPGLVGLRGGAARPVLAVRLAWTALPGGGRDLLVRDDGGSRLPGNASDRADRRDGP